MGGRDIGGRLQRMGSRRLGLHDVCEQSIGLHLVPDPEIVAHAVPQEVQPYPLPVVLGEVPLRLPKVALPPHIPPDPRLVDAASGHARDAPEGVERDDVAADVLQDSE